VRLLPAYFSLGRPYCKTAKTRSEFPIALGGVEIRKN
jgi:hypothetical protein